MLAKKAVKKLLQSKTNSLYEVVHHDIKLTALNFGGSFDSYLFKVCYLNWFPIDLDVIVDVLLLCGFL